MQSISSLNLVLQWHLCNAHVYESSHGGTKFFIGLFYKVRAFIRMKYLDLLDEMISSLNSYTPLLCLLILSAWMCCCLHFSSICIHVSGSRELHIEHVIEGYASLPKNSCFLAFPIYCPCLSFKRHVFAS